jgi:hypothetical protein
VALRLEQYPTVWYDVGDHRSPERHSFLLEVHELDDVTARGSTLWSHAGINARPHPTSVFVNDGIEAIPSYFRALTKGMFNWIH